MTIPLIVRKAGSHEKDYVLSTWKQALKISPRKWRKELDDRNFWCLVNHAVDRITFPSSIILVGCHKDSPDVPVCWVAIRKLAGLSTYELVYYYVRLEAFTAEIYEELLSQISKDYLIAKEVCPYNPYLELRRP